MTRSRTRWPAQRTQVRAVASAWVAALLFANLFLSSGMASAGGIERCRVRQLTETYGLSSGFRDHSLSGDGTQLAMGTRSDLTGQNPDHRPKVFVYNTLTGGVDQVPPTRGGEAGDPQISADGSTVLFTAGPIFRYDVSLGQTTRLTPPGSLVGAPAVSADASVIAYVKDVDRGFFMPFSVVITDGATSTTTELPAGLNSQYEARALRPAVSPDGTRVAYLGSNDPTGGNADGSFEVFVHDRTTETTVQATSTPGRNVGAPQFIEDGAKVAFLSNGEFAGPNPPHELHWYIYDLATDTISRMMSDLGAEGFISEDGGRIAYRADTNIHGANPDETDELYSYDTATGETTQLTAMTDRTFDNIYGVSLSRDGSTMAFVSDADLTGNNPDHNSEFFLATTCGPPPRPDASIAVSGAGPFAGDDVYSSIPIPEQKQTIEVAPGQTRTFFVQIQNDRSITDSLKVHGVGSGSPGYRIRYRQGRTDITEEVRAGTFRTQQLEPGAVETIKIKITATSATSGSGRRVDLTARSTTNPLTPDTVRAKVTRT